MTSAQTPSQASKTPSPPPNATGVGQSRVEQVLDALGTVSAPLAVLLDERITTEAKLVYLYLCKRAGEKKICWPTQERIVEDLGISVRTVGRHIQELTNLQLILPIRNGSLRTQQGQRFKANSYMIIPLMDVYTNERWLEEKHYQMWGRWP